MYDSWYTDENTVDSLDKALQDTKAVSIVTEHDDIIAGLKTLDLSKLGIEVLIDGRNCMDSKILQEQGILYRGIGRKA